MDILSQYSFQINPSAGTVLLNDRPISEPLAAPSMGGISLTLSQPEEEQLAKDRTDRLEKLKETFPLVRVNLARAFTAQSAPETGVLPVAPSHPLLEGISVSYTETAGLEGAVPTKPVCPSDREVEGSYYLDLQRCGLVGVMSRHCGCSAHTSVRYLPPPRPYRRDPYRKPTAATLYLEEYSATTTSLRPKPSPYPKEFNASCYRNSEETASMNKLFGRIPPTFRNKESHMFGKEVPMRGQDNLLIFLF
ncbi:hypothetical protein NQ314_000245 [Rhamnusium bicolor]|uniref:Uncharacterized protein n=1 Tax=Rhamnusium bicolor TaxID=1586634 RepID=A0AAV8ZV46_9CUCU|nr:hypothetical protein NQ314_000245 [Rhamnusium bicolor]